MKYKERKIELKNYMRKFQKIHAINHWYEYIYEHNELAMLQDFKDDNYRFVKKRINVGQVIRYFCLAGLLATIFLQVLEHVHPNIEQKEVQESHYYFKYFTWCVLMIQVISLKKSMEAINGYKWFVSNPSRQAIHHLLYTSAITLTFVVLLIYWMFIHHKSHAVVNQADLLTKVNKCILHTVP